MWYKKKKTFKRRKHFESPHWSTVHSVTPINVSSSSALPCLHIITTAGRVFRDWDACYISPCTTCSAVSPLETEHHPELGQGQDESWKHTVLLWEPCHIKSIKSLQVNTATLGLQYSVIHCVYTWNPNSLCSLQGSPRSSFLESVNAFSSSIIVGQCCSNTQHFPKACSQVSPGGSFSLEFAMLEHYSRVYFIRQHLMKSYQQKRPAGKLKGIFHVYVEAFRDVSCPRCLARDFTFPCGSFLMSGQKHSLKTLKSNSDMTRRQCYRGNFN